MLSTLTGSRVTGYVGVALAGMFVGAGGLARAFPTLIGGGYPLSPATLINLTATVDGPSGTNDWEVTIVNNSGVEVSFTERTVCASG